MTPLLSGITTRLTSISDTPALDASVLLAHILNKLRTWVMAHPELTLTAEQQKQLDDSLTRLERGEPLPYVVGHWEFFGMDFDVTPDVLIPRPETELLVQKAIAWLQESTVRKTTADVGTGSGAIAVCIATHVPDARLLATDISYKALKVAQRNALKYDVVDRIDFVQCDLLPTVSNARLLGRSIDLICANLPYIQSETLRNLPIYGHEPALALDGGVDGMRPISSLLDIAPEWLSPNGKMLLEIEASRGPQVRKLAADMFPEATIHLHQDLAGRDRLLEIML
jgi:release factor glutamine methyltransferase